MSSTRYASFLVRLWSEVGQKDPASTPTWQGEVEHIQTSQQWTFDTLDELLHLLHREAEEVDSARRE